MQQADISTLDAAELLATGSIACLIMAVDTDGRWVDRGVTTVRTVSGKVVRFPTTDGANTFSVLDFGHGPVALEHWCAETRTGISKHVPLQEVAVTDWEAYFQQPGRHTKAARK